MDMHATSNEEVQRPQDYVAVSVFPSFGFVPDHYRYALIPKFFLPYRFYTPSLVCCS